MLTERIWSGNSFRNFHYLIACPQSGEALAVDPLEWRLCLSAARERGWQITQILNTHEHTDHTGGNAGLKAATHAPVLAHAAAAARIGGVDRGLARGDIIKVGRTVELECLDTPGHTLRARVPAGARRGAGAVLRRHTVQRWRRQLPQRRRPAASLRDLRDPARETAG